MPKRFVKASGVDPDLVLRLRDLAEQEGITVSSLLERMVAEHVGLPELARPHPRPTALPDHFGARMSAEIHERLVREVDARGLPLSAYFRNLVATKLGGASPVMAPSSGVQAHLDLAEEEEHYLRSA